MGLCKGTDILSSWLLCKPEGLGERQSLPFIPLDPQHLFMA